MSFAFVECHVAAVIGGGALVGWEIGMGGPGRVIQSVGTSVSSNIFGFTVTFQCGAPRSGRRRLCAAGKFFLRPFT